LQELDAESLFQRVKAASDHRRRNAFGTRGSGQTAFGDDLDEGGDLFELVHGAAIALFREVFFDCGFTCD
jgi:hypothetical protein